MSFIKVKNLIHKFNIYDEQRNIIGDNYALNDISIDINKGEYIAILGHNGSGKSTLARHLNNLLFPDGGSVWINEIESNAEDYLSTCEIRKNVGMVFQNPDNQIVGTTVEEDTAFGPENLCMNPDRIKNNVYKCLKNMNMEKYRFKSPSRLSGGQKQRVAIAGILAMHPQCIVFDEATAMLDPQGRAEIMGIISELHNEGMTIVHITHFMEEVVNADRIFVMDKGKILLQGTPKEVFGKSDVIQKAGLEVPLITDIAIRLKEDGYDMPIDILDVEHFVEIFIEKLYKNGMPEE